LPLHKAQPTKTFKGDVMNTINTNNAIQTYNTNNDSLQKAVKTLENGDKEVYGVSVSNQTKFSQEASIVSHFFSDKESVLPDSMKLTYQAAIEKINEILNPENDNVDDKITQEKLNEKGMGYWSPKNTADRIIEQASSFLVAFQKAHPELEGQALLDKFDEVVGGGLRQGFSEAKSVLEDLKVFNGEVEENFSSTFNLVEKGMLDFRNEQLTTTKTDKDNKEDDIT